MTRAKLRGAARAALASFQAIVPFTTGALIMFDWHAGRWVWFWIVLCLAAVLATVNTVLSLSREEAVQTLQEVKPMLEQAHRILIEYTVESMKYGAVVRALLGRPLLRIPVEPSELNSRKIRRRH